MTKQERLEAQRHDIKQLKTKIKQNLIGVFGADDIVACDPAPPSSLCALWVNAHKLVYAQCKYAYTQLFTRS